MSFWDNNKDSIKSGSLAALKGAGRATKAVGKAGYHAAKNHNNNKKKSDNDSNDDLSAPAPPINYQDPKAFPPPPKHVAAHGVADPMPGFAHSMSYQQHPQQTQMQYPPQQPQMQNQQLQPNQIQGQQMPPPLPPMQGQQAPPPLPPMQGQQMSSTQTYQLQQPYSQNGQSSYASQTELHPYQQQQPQAYTQPAVFQQQPQPYAQPTLSQQEQINSGYFSQESTSQIQGSLTPPDVLNYSNPYHSRAPPPLPPPQQQQPLPSRVPELQSSQPYGNNNTGSFTEQPLQPLQQQNNFEQPPSYPQSGNSTQYVRPSLEPNTSQNSTLPTNYSYGQGIAAAAAPHTQLSNEQSYGQSYGQSQPPQYAQASQPPQQLQPLQPPQPPQPPQPLQPPQHPQQLQPPQPPQLLHSQNSTSQTGYVQSYMTQPLPDNGEPTESATTPNYGQTPVSMTPPGYTPIPPRRETQSTGSVSLASSTTAGKTSTSHSKPGEESVAEPKFKTNLMDFDITKYGAPPPKARRTKEEETKIEMRKQEKIRLQQIKEQSMNKAKEATSRYVSTFGSPAATGGTNSDGSSFHSADTPSVADSNNSIVGSQPPPAPPRINSVVETRQSITKSLSHNNQADEAEHTPKPFHLPDISQFQPPPLAHPRHTPARTSSHIPPAVTKPDLSLNHDGNTRTLPEPPSINMEIGGISTTQIKATCDGIPSNSLLNAPLNKKVPPPKPAKPSFETEKQKKVPPPKPSKPITLAGNDELKARPKKPSKPANLSASVGSENVKSTAAGSHIKDLQQRLGNLQFQ